MNLNNKKTLKCNFNKLILKKIFLQLVLLMLTVGIMSPYATVQAQGGQGIKVSGTVTDATTGEPLPGVSIVVQGTTTGTATDLSGTYSLNVPGQESVLVFSYIGYVMQSIAVGSQTVISIALSADLAQLEEVVVVGYGSQKKESIVGAISQATGEEIKSTVQGADLGTALRGSLPGLVALQSTGIPEAGITCLLQMPRGGTALIKHSFLLGARRHGMQLPLLSWLMV
jgi:TonB-dependent starch-binding outer membrane protein SusC